MASSPKQFGDDLQTLIDAWTDLAPDKSFGGMTLAQFKTKVKPSFDKRGAITTLENQMTQALDDRDDADGESAAAQQLVVKGVVGDPAYGDDCDLYEAMGYTRKSERKSGLTRKKNTPPPGK